MFYLVCHKYRGFEVIILTILNLPLPKKTKLRLNLSLTKIGIANKNTIANVVPCSLGFKDI